VAGGGSLRELGAVSGGLTRSASLGGSGLGGSTSFGFTGSLGSGFLGSMTTVSVLILSPRNPSCAAKKNTASTIRL